MRNKNAPNKNQTTESDESNCKPQSSYKHLTYSTFIFISLDFLFIANAYFINLASSEDFEVGLYPTLYISVTDDVPTVWIGDENWMKDGSFYLSIEDCFGECSRVKYKFVYEVLGIYDFSVWNVWGFMYDKAKFVPAKKLLKKELEKWEATNGPMMDENNNRVTFPD